VLEQQRCEQVQAAFPGREIVCRVLRDVVDAFDSRLFQCVGGRLETGSAALAATETHEHDFDFQLEGGHVGYILRAERAAAEDADMGELVEVGQGYSSGLHAAHGEPGQSAVFAVGVDGIVRLDVGNDVFEQIILEGRSPASHPTTHAAGSAAT